MDMKMQVDSPQSMDTKENMIQSQVMHHTAGMDSTLSMGDLGQQVMSPSESLMNPPVSVENAIFQQGVITKQETIDSILQQGSPSVHQQTSNPMMQVSSPMMQPLDISDHVNASAGNHQQQQQQSYGLNINTPFSQESNVHHIDMDKILSAGLHGNASLGVGTVTTNATDMITSHLSRTMVTSAQPIAQLSRQNSSNSITSNSSNSYSHNNILDVSNDFANILQDAKKDHPENIDKMAEAILNVSIIWTSNFKGCLIQEKKIYSKFWSGFFSYIKLFASEMPDCLIDLIVFNAIPAVKFFENDEICVFFFRRSGITMK